jgi:hypothetical protein
MIFTENKFNSPKSNSGHAKWKHGHGVFIAGSPQNDWEGYQGLRKSASFGQYNCHRELGNDKFQLVVEGRV